MEGLHITPSSFSDAMALQRAVAFALTKSSIQINTGILDGEDIDAGSLDTIIKMILQVGISEEIERCLFVCAERVLYKSAKVDRDFFEPVENRELYYPIMLEIARVNLAPFFKKISSTLTGLIGKNIKGQG